MIGIVAFAAALQAAVPAVVQPAGDWRTVPVATGFWAWRSVPGGSEALFADGRGTQLIIRCAMVSRTVSLVRTGAFNGAPLVVRTTSGDRTLPWIATLAATDPLLDAVAFSRGRFAVEVAGAPRLVVPAWPEAARAVEDCRK